MLTFGSNSKFNMPFFFGAAAGIERVLIMHFSILSYSIRVLVTSDNSGLIETVRNSISIHSIKKDAYTRGWNDAGAVYTLYDYFKRVCTFSWLMVPMFLFCGPNPDFFSL